ncbi:DUF6138 family protein [Saccharibacillus sacchari]|uniref:DUF6138 family protein n=1 Tax=Saccharibacillus sacchari TaxID=456493 RepID=A0ACC6PEQ1_9BACL
MSNLSDRLLEDVWKQLRSIYAREQQRLGEIKEWSPLQAGVFNYLKISRLKPQWGKTPHRLAIDVYEPFSWSDDAYKFELDPYIEYITETMLRDEFWPGLLKKINELRLSNEMGPRFFDYRFELVADFQSESNASSFKLNAILIDEIKLAKLKETLERFVQSKVLSDPPARPKAKDYFFFSRLLVNADLLPEGRVAPDPQQLEALSLGLSRKLKENPERLAEWKREYSHALKGWAEEQFLPLHFDETDDYPLRFRIKSSTERPTLHAEALDFFLYAALQVGHDDPQLRLSYLRYASDLGSDTAERYLKTGSGKVESSRKGSLFQGKANDVLQTVELKLAAEKEQAYREALNYVCDLMRQGFPTAYTLKLKSMEKHGLPLKKLAKSPLHRFFANALQYPALFPIIAEYADLVMDEFAWYGDVEAGEKSVMPGTYAVLGLGLHSEDYDSLLVRYMQLVDTEHQSAHDDYAALFASTRGLNEHTLPTLISTLLGSGQSARPIKESLIDTPELARLLSAQLLLLEDYEQELAIYRLFGGHDKLVRMAKKAEADLATALEELATVTQPKVRKRR